LFWYVIKFKFLNTHFCIVTTWNTKNLFSIEEQPHHYWFKGFQWHGCLFAIHIHNLNNLWIRQYLKKTHSFSLYIIYYNLILILFVKIWKTCCFEHKFYFLSNASGYIPTWNIFFCHIQQIHNPMGIITY
jgi:hypothetical protein